MSDLLGFIAFILVIFILPCAIVYACVHQLDRDKWLGAHCKIIGKISDSAGIGFSSNGNVVPTFIGGKTGYQCDDGMQYWE